MEKLEAFSKNRKKDRESPKRRMGRLGGNLREFVHETKVDHVCAKCGRLIPRGTPATKLAPLEKGKPVIEKIEYFHSDGMCPEPPIEGAPF